MPRRSCPYAGTTRIRFEGSPRPTSIHASHKRGAARNRPAASQPLDGAPLGQRHYPQTVHPASRLRFDDAARKRRQNRCACRARAYFDGKVYWWRGNDRLAHHRLDRVPCRLVGAGEGFVAWFDTKIWAPIALGQLWYELDRSSLNLVQAVIQRYLSPFLWDRIILNILLCWASAVLIVIGASILLLTRARRVSCAFDWRASLARSAAALSAGVAASVGDARHWVGRDRPVTPARVAAGRGGNRQAPRGACDKGAMEHERCTG